MIEDTGARRGGVTPGGSAWPTDWSFSETTWRARKTSVPQSNSAKTMLNPWAVVERTRRIPVAPFSAVSIGKVTSASISSGPIPCASVRTVTVGAERSGKTSTGIRSAKSVPPTRTRPAAAATRSRFRMDHPIRRRSMVRS